MILDNLEFLAITPKYLKLTFAPGPAHVRALSCAYRSGVVARAHHMGRRLSIQEGMCLAGYVKWPLRGSLALWMFRDLLRRGEYPVADAAGVLFNCLAACTWP